MDQQEAQQKFEQADGLFRSGNYAEALIVLNELDLAFPNTKNILFPMAMCLDKLGQPQEALRICDRLIMEFEATKAMALKQSILAKVAPKANSTALDDLKAPPIVPEDAPPAIPAQHESFFQSANFKYGLIALAVVAVLLLLPFGLQALKGSSPDPAPEAVSTMESGADAAPVMVPTQGTIIGLTVLVLVLSFLLSCGVAYAVLRFMGKLLHDDLVPDLIDVGVIFFVVFLCNMVPLVGWIIALVVIAKHYDMSCGELVIFALLTTAASYGIAILLVTLFLGGVGGLGAMIPAAAP